MYNLKYKLNNKRILVEIFKNNKLFNLRTIKKLVEIKWLFDIIFNVNNK